MKGYVERIEELQEMIGDADFYQDDSIVITNIDGVLMSCPKEVYEMLVKKFKENGLRGCYEN